MNLGQKLPRRDPIWIVTANRLEQRYSFLAAALSIQLNSLTQPRFQLLAPRGITRRNFIRIDVSQLHQMADRLALVFHKIAGIG